MKQPERTAFRIHPIMAYVLPFALFIVLGAAESWKALADYYPWVYACKVVAVLAAWCCFRKRFPKPSTHGLAAAVLFGVAGAVVWIALCELNLEKPLFSLLPSWLGSGERVGYNPFEKLSSPVGQWAFVAIRLAGLALVVPLMEEVFWRGFLIRYLVSEDFESVPLGKFTPVSFGVVTVLFTLAHPELLAALAWGAAINLLFYQTKNLWACIVAHAVTNLLLGVYILAVDAWQLW